MQILEWTAWKMSPPKPYEAFHLTFWLTGLFVSFFAAFLLRHTKEKGNRIVLFCVGVFLAVTEIYRQLFLTFYVNGGKYNFEKFPFQLCDVPMYICLIVPFLKSERLKKALYTFAATFGFMGGFISFFSPESMCYSYVILTVHSFTWHMLLVFIGLYLFFTGRAGKTLLDFTAALPVYYSCAFIAFLFNLACLPIEGAKVNMFYVGPRPSPLVVCRDIVAQCGWAVNTLVYTSALTACAFGFYLFYFGIKKLLCKRSEK